VLCCAEHVSDYHDVYTVPQKRTNFETV